MSFKQDIQEVFKKVLARHGGVKRAAAASLGVNVVTFWGWIQGTRTPNVETLSKAMDMLGIRVTYDECPDMSREVCFVKAETVEAGKNLDIPPDAEDYFAVPLVDGEVGAGPGYLPQENVKSWLLVYKWQKSILHRSNLIAVELASDAHSMEPTLCPHDIVLVDRNDTTVSNNGKIWLVLDPDDGGGRIKRVNVKFLEEEKDFRLTFYSDNPDFPPEAYSLKKDYGDSWQKAIAGRVVWSWSDMTNK